jgi:1,3-alpha-isomaltosidase
VQSWPVYLPAGQWVDAWTGIAHAGPTTIERAVPLEIIPVYVRAAAWDSLRDAFQPAALETAP